MLFESPETGGHLVVLTRPGVLRVVALTDPAAPGLILRLQEGDELVPGAPAAMIELSPIQAMELSESIAKALLSAARVVPVGPEWGEGRFKSIALAIGSTSPAEELAATN